MFNRNAAALPSSSKHSPNAGRPLQEGDKVFLKSRAMQHQCPHCQTQHDMCTGVSGDPEVIPCEGDLTICATCHTVLLFAAGHRLDYATLDDWDCLDPKIRRAMELSFKNQLRFGAGA